MNRRALVAWTVHLYTGSGTLLALLALRTGMRGNYGAAFGCLAAAMFVDATDGVLARWANVKSVIPGLDGSRLDDIVDYLTYVFVPVVLACHMERLLPHAPWNVAIASLPLLASAYGFCQVDAKTPDHFFKGFPSYWNVVVFYLYALAVPPWISAGVLTIFSLLVFVPIRYFYPSRGATARTATLVLAALWVLMVLALLAQFPRPSRKLALVSLFFPAYYMGFSAYLHFTSSGRRRERENGLTTDALKPSSAKETRSPGSCQNGASGLA